MNQNHDFIESLMELYKDVPQQDAELAARRVAVLVELYLKSLEENKVAITRESLLAAFMDKNYFKKIA